MNAVDQNRDTSPMFRCSTYAKFIKLEHTIFSLPVVFAGTLLYTRGWPGPALAGLILLAAASGRVMAMGLNRLIDHAIDTQNPRTRRRELPSQAMNRQEAWFIVIAAGIVYLASAAAIAPVCAWLSPIPVIFFVVYPYLKRVTPMAHLGLGLAWSMAPVGGWLAGAKTVSGIGEVFWLWLFSVWWVSGFDVIYGILDQGFDRKAGLHSLPAKLGAPKALMIAAWMHAAAFWCLVMLWEQQLYSPVAFLWLTVAGILFVWQHAVAQRRPEFAFFQLNGAMGFVVLALVLAGMR